MQFKVETVKTEETLQDFILFMYRVKNSGGTFKMVVFGLGMLVIGYLAKEKPPAAIGCAIVGTIVILFALLKHKLAVSQLKKSDIAYKEQTKLGFEFTNGGIYVYKNDELDENVGGYSHVTCLYGDEKNYYVGINNEDLFLLPRKDFTEGNQEEFAEFIEKKSSEKYEFTPATVRNRWAVHRNKQKQFEAEYDAKAAKLRNEKKRQ